MTALARSADAVLAAAMFAVDPHGTGVRVRARAGPVRQKWLEYVRALLGPHTPFVRVPLHATVGRLLGELDLSATLNAGRPIAARGLLAEAHDGVLCLAMAERMEVAIAASVAAAMDAGIVALERDGLAAREPARFGGIALDEGIGEDEMPPPALLDRLALWIDLEGVPLDDFDDHLFEASDIASAKKLLNAVSIGEDMIGVLCHAGAAVGIASLRPIWHAARVSRIAAALDGRATVTDADVIVAGRLVLAPRAVQIPPLDASPEDKDHDTPRERDSTREESEPDRMPQGPLEDRVLAAVQAALPADVIGRLDGPGHTRRRNATAGRAGTRVLTARRGRPVGVRSGTPGSGTRLNLVETLRAAAPWQRLRQKPDPAELIDGQRRVLVRASDFRVQRLVHRTATTSIFVVDASGSSALHRLAEAKGAVELLLADCYVRRDQVAVIAFRGTRAELLLPPTRSLARARRCLAGIPGGGGTPLASGIELALEVADGVKRRGQQPILVILIDGRANVGRDGLPGREHAEADALTLAKRVRTEGHTAILIDISMRPQAFSQQLAADMGARYLPLPQAGAEAISSAALAGSRGAP